MIMKIQHIANTILAALLLCSCNGELLEPDRIEPAAGKVRYTFNVDFGEEPGTKALTNDAQIRNMYVAVFDTAGYKLSEYARAELDSPTTGTGTNDVNYQYSIELTASSSARILHFIANAPESLSYGSESEVIGSLYTSLDNDDVDKFQESYWQRIVMDEIPIRPVYPIREEFGSDEAAYNAAVTEYTAGMERYNAAAARLNNIKLVRNYSKVTLVKKADLANFEIEGMWMVNYPDRGTLAPYNRNTGKFMSDYLTYEDVETVEKSDGGNYQGFMLATTKFISPQSADDFVGTMIESADITEDPKCTAVGYVYEREKVLESPMYLIVKAKYGPSKEECFYKVALQDRDGNFYSMLRNFNYLVEIQTVASKGKNTAMEALHGAPSGDISLNVEFQEITSISDGEARMSVSHTSLMLVGKKNETKTDTLWFQYEPTPSSYANYLYNDLSNRVGVEISYDETGASGPVINSSTIDYSDIAGTGRRAISFETVPIDDVRKTQSITITGKNNDGEYTKTITRKIDLILCEYLTMDLSTGPNTDSGNVGHVSMNQGESSTVTIGIETGLPSSVFPLDFKIEAARRTLTPDGDVLPVENGTSTILDASVRDASNALCKDHPSFWFIRTVTREEYDETVPDPEDGKKHFTARFKNNITDGVTEHIYVSQAYFEQSEIDLVKYAPQSFDSVSISPSTMTVGTNATYSFTLKSGHVPAKVTVGLARLEEAPASGSYTRQLTYLRSESINEGGSDIMYDIYEMPVSTTSNSIKLVAYESGKGYVKLWADEYPVSTTSVTIN